MRLSGSRDKSRAANVFSRGLWIAGTSLAAPMLRCNMRSHVRQPHRRDRTRRGDDPRPWGECRARARGCLARPGAGQPVRAAVRGRGGPPRTVVARSRGARRAIVDRRDRRRGRRRRDHRARPRALPPGGARILRDLRFVLQGAAPGLGAGTGDARHGAAGDPRPRSTPVGRGARRQSRNRLRHRPAALYADLRASYQG
jgi:hypothetical protein